VGKKKEVPHLSDADFVAFIDGSLSEDRHERVAMHLLRCTACRRQLVEYRNVGEVLRQHFPLVDDVQARAAIIGLTSGNDTEMTGRPPKRDD
jgi:anti-sigma factor RsiW